MVLVGDEQGEVTVYLLRNIPKPSDHQVMSDMWSYFDIAMYGSNNGNNIVYLHPKMCTLFFASYVSHSSSEHFTQICLLVIKCVMNMIILAGCNNIAELTDIYSTAEHTRE